MKIKCLYSLLLTSSFLLPMQEELLPKVTAEQKLFYRSFALDRGQMVNDFLKKNDHKGESHPGIPKWPEEVPEKCRTIEKLATGPYAGKKAQICRSLWTMYGINSITTAKPQHICHKLLSLKFYLDNNSFEDASATLYYAKIEGYGRVIPQTWLSPEDTISLYNFHRYELEALASQLFAKDSPSRGLFLEKINDELTKDRNLFFGECIDRHVKRHGICPDKDTIEVMAEITENLFTENDTFYPDYFPRPSLFLHAALLEAFKHNDYEIISQRKILYNSLAILELNILEGSKKKEADDDSQSLKLKIEHALAGAELLRPQDETDDLNFKHWLRHPKELHTYFALLTTDIRRLVFDLLYKNKLMNTTVQVEESK